MTAMNRLLILNQRYILTCVLLVLCFTLAAQDWSVFRARAQENQSWQLRLTLTTSDTISLEGMGTIYSLSIDATIHQPKEGSFTRIVLEDINGHDYLVAESDWFRNDTTNIFLNHFCEETALLPGITPLRLKCLLAGGANVSITDLHFSIQPPTRDAGTMKQIIKDIKKSQIDESVERINNYNKKHHKLWRAKTNEINMLPYEDLKRLYPVEEGASYMANFIHYGSGLYEIGDTLSITPEPQSLCVDSFDWSLRHGMNWITAAKNQWNTPFCQTFAVVGMTEAITRLYFNDTISIDLSEQDVISYNYNNHVSWATLSTACNYIVNHGVIDENSLPFDSLNSHPTLIEPRPDGKELISFTYITNSSWIGNLGQLDQVKRLLINLGPGAASLKFPGGNHAMLLYGYGRVKPGIYWCFGPQYNQENEEIDSTDTRIGRTYWMFKNSWGTSWGMNGCANIICHDYNRMDQIIYISSPITRRNHTDADIICKDSDGDGYYNWGIGSIPSSLPSWAPTQKDGDDTNHLLGPLTYYGKFININPDSLDVLYINNDSIINSNQYIANHIRIGNNSTLTVKAQLTTNRITNIHIESGSTLHVDSGTIRNALISPEIGSSIIVSHGGQIISNKHHGFDIPLGVLLNIENGSIE